VFSSVAWLRCQQCRNSRFACVMVTDDGPELVRHQSRHQSGQSGHSVGLRSEEFADASEHRSALLGTRRWPIIDPTKSRFLNYWDSLVALLIIGAVFLVPFETAFLKPRLDLLFALNCCIDFVFFVDLILQFFTARSCPYNPYLLLREPGPIAAAYLRGWFWLDLISVVPADICCIALEGRVNRRKHGTLLLVRLVRLLRLARIVRIFDRWHNSVGYSNTTIQIVRFVVMLSVTSHWAACIWGGIALANFSEHTWIHAVQASKGGPDEIYTSILDIYIMSLYWAVVTITSIGYGDIVAQNGLEYRVASALMTVMACMWAYTIGTLCGLVSTMEPHLVHHKQTLDDLNNLMAESRMPQNMRKDLRRYFHAAKDLSQEAAEKSIIARVSPLLQGQVAHWMHKEWLTKVSYFSLMSTDAIAQVANSVKMLVYIPLEESFRERTLFILSKGVAAVGGIIRRSGSIWGEDMLLSNRHLRDNTVSCAITYVHILSLSFVDFDHVTERFPADKRKLRWAIIKIGLTRCAQRVTKALASMPDASAWHHTLTDTQRLMLYTDVLQGKFKSSSFRDYFEALSASVPLKQVPIESETIQDSVSPLHDLLRTVAGLSAQVESITASHEKLRESVAAIVS